MKEKGKNIKKENENVVLFKSEDPVHGCPCRLQRPQNT